MTKTLTQQQKSQIASAIWSNDNLYNKIINSIIDGQILLSKPDYMSLGWEYTKEELKQYFLYNVRLKKYLNNQIYPKFQKEIDQAVYQKQKNQDLNSLLNQRYLSRVILIIQKYDVKDQNFLKKIYSNHKLNSDLKLLQKLVDRIDDKKIKDQFENRKWYQPSLFAKKKFINIAKQLYNDMNKAYAIAKDVYAVANYMSVVNQIIR